MQNQNVIEFYKYSGTGNDFIIFDGLKEGLLRKFAGVERPEFVAKICQRAVSAGADGVVFVEPSQEYDFQWDFYNSDGSTAEMCGNAARCVARMTHDLGYTKESMKFKTTAGVIEATINADQTISVQLTSPSLTLTDKAVEVKGGKFFGVFVNTGVPHFVMETERDFEPMKQIARELRASKDFGAKGSNVTLFRKVNTDHIRSISFERGIEDFTLSCGTGAVAAGLVFQKKQGEQETKVDVPGGRLFVSLNPVTKKPVLRGTANFIYKGELNVEGLL